MESGIIKVCKVFSVLSCLYKGNMFVYGSNCDKTVCNHALTYLQVNVFQDESTNFQLRNLRKFSGESSIGNWP